MISRFAIRNFKAYQELDLELKPLTVLTGLNSSGKSTIIQALLLSQVAALAGTSVPLNGPFGLNLGEASIVQNAESRGPIQFVLRREDGVQDDFKFDVPDDRATHLTRIRPHKKAQLGLKIVYLSAERLGPRDLTEIAATETPNDMVGDRGQYTAFALARMERSRVREPLLHPHTAQENLPLTLGEQTEAWLSSIVRPVQIRATWLPDVGAATLRFRDPSVFSDWTRPANVGFGFSYALPIVTAGLACLEGMTLIVESPEAHLHPAGQSAIGRFLVRVAASGVQTIIETHSDHLLNGIRLEIASERKLMASDAIIHFFSNGSTHSEVAIQPGGSLSEWPAGFFDQADLDLHALARIQRPR